MTCLFFVMFSWFVVKAKTQRQVLALALVGTTAAVLVAPPRVQAQSSLVGAIQAVLNVINGVIHSGLSSINSIRAAMNSFYRSVVWPVQLINQARAQVTQIIAQYRNLMWGILRINVSSATLPATQRLEQVIRDQQTNNFAVLTTNYGSARSHPTSTGPNRGEPRRPGYDGYG